jgi:hypothetical protein
MHIKTPAAFAQAHVGTIDDALVPPAPAVGSPPFGSVCVTCCRYYDNANTHNTKGGEIHRVHDNHVQNDVTVGVGVLPNAPLPAQLDSHIPEYLHIARREALSQAKLVARYQDGEANATATSVECEVRALAAATAAGWVPFANLSDVGRRPALRALCLATTKTHLHALCKAPQDPTADSSARARAAS